MRTIEKKMLAAIRNCKNWTSGNTRVEYTAEETRVYLHGHNIAKMNNEGCWHINLCGWNTNTTRSRLTAILQAYTGTYGVGTKQWRAEIRYASHTRKIDSCGWYTI